MAGLRVGASILLSGLFLAACSSSPGLPPASAGVDTASQYRDFTGPRPPESGPAGFADDGPIAVAPRIVTPSRRLQCVPYARNLSGIEIRGDAWTWWHKAAGQYERSERPEIGSVLVLRRTHRNRYGHIAVVTQIIDDREILVSHANWLNRGRIHIDTPVRDVSRNNDWSRVRVWYTPGHYLGRTIYPADGFVLPRQMQALR